MVGGGPHQGISSLPFSPTFSIFSTTGGGLAAVTAAAISAPMRKASSRDRPGSSTNRLSARWEGPRAGGPAGAARRGSERPHTGQARQQHSAPRAPASRLTRCRWLPCCTRVHAQPPRPPVSPYTTCARQPGWLFTMRMAPSSVSRPDCTIASASSAMGMRPGRGRGRGRWASPHSLASKWTSLDRQVAPLEQWCMPAASARWGGTWGRGGMQLPSSGAGPHLRSRRRCSRRSRWR